MGARPWMRTTLYVLFAYVFVNFFLGIALGPESEADQFRIFSGHWMVFYFALSRCSGRLNGSAKLLQARVHEGTSVHPGVESIS